MNELIIMKIALNTYSLRNEWELMKNIGGWDLIIKVIKMIDVEDVELLDSSFHSDPKMLEEIQDVFSSVGLNVFSLGPHVNPLTDERNRQNRIDGLKHWVDVAADHGIGAFRVALGGGSYTSADLKPKNVDTAVEWILPVLEPAVKYAEERDVAMCIETHHQFSSNPEFQEKLLEKIPSKSLGFIFDIGNFETDDLRWQSLEVLTKKNAVKYVHAKAYDFDEKGMETTLDYHRVVKTLQDAGINVNLSIEWEGKRAGPIGALATKELCKYSIARASGKEYEINTSYWQLDDDDFIDELLG
ncbi:MAG: sugar phosphate isomerase/epimerase family protein [Promethearchaeota archaeon]